MRTNNNNSAKRESQKIKSRLQTTATRILLGILTAVVIFHVGIVVKIIPHSIAWGGRIESEAQLYVLESISILVNILLGVALLLKGGLMRCKVPERGLNGVLWVFLALFLLNTVGNLLAESEVERYFAVLTLAMAALIRIVLRKNNNYNAGKPPNSN